MSDEKKRNGTTMDGDEAELAKMGYKQELKRDLSLLQVCLDSNHSHELLLYRHVAPHCQNFGVSFSIISVITGIPSLFLYGLVSHRLVPYHC